MATEQLSRCKPDQLTPRKYPRRKPPSISIQSAVATWVSDGQAQGHSPKTIAERESTFNRFIWWLENEASIEPTLEVLSPETIRRFLTYCREANPKGRFGSERVTAKRQARPATVFAYFRELRAFTRFCLQEGLLEESPLRNLKAPRVPHDPVEPFTPEQVQGLLDATAHTIAPARNRAIILTLLDTGLRVSELCSLKVGDVGNETGHVSLTGKGGKRRTIYLGTSARRSLRQYIRKWRLSADPEEPLFIAEGGTKQGSGMGTAGVRQMLKECGNIAGIQGVRVSPHTLRHSFAISFLRGGGNLFELQQLMGHADLTILRRYVKLADGDLAKAHREASPADRMKLR